MPDCSCRQKQRPFAHGAWTGPKIMHGSIRCETTDWVYNQARSETYRRSEPIDNEIDSSSGEREGDGEREGEAGGGGVVHGDATKACADCQ